MKSVYFQNGEHALFTPRYPFKVFLTQQIQSSSPLRPERYENLMTTKLSILIPLLVCRHKYNVYHHKLVNHNYYMNILLCNLYLCSIKVLSMSHLGLARAECEVICLNVLCDNMELKKNIITTLKDDWGITFLDYFSFLFLFVTIIVSSIISTLPVNFEDCVLFKKNMYFHKMFEIS